MDSNALGRVKGVVRRGVPQFEFKDCGGCRNVTAAGHLPTTHKSDGTPGSGKHEATPSCAGRNRRGAALWA